MVKIPAIHGRFFILFYLFIKCIQPKGLWNNKYAEWNEDEKQTNKRHPSQLIRVLHSVSVIVHKTDEFEQSNNFIKPWKSSCKIEFQIENSKETAKSSYYSTLSKIQFINSEITNITLYGWIKIRICNFCGHICTNYAKMEQFYR